MQDLSQWLSLVENRELRIGIIGLGYVGLPLVLLFSQEGFRVTGFDIDADKVDKLNAGESYIHRIEAQQIKHAQAKGFRATAALADVAEVDAILICVPTPLSDHHTPVYELHRRHDGRDRRSPSSRPTGGSRKHDLSRYDRRVDYASH